MTFSDLQSWLIVQASRLGYPVEQLNRIAAVSIVQHFVAAERWVRLEGGYTPSAPFWLEQREAVKLAAMLRGQRGTDARLLRQALERLIVDMGGAREEEDDAAAAGDE